MGCQGSQLGVETFVRNKPSRFLYTIWYHELWTKKNFPDRTTANEMAGTAGGISTTWKMLVINLNLF